MGQNGKRRNGTTTTTTIPLDGGAEPAEESLHHPADAGARRVREGELYYVNDPAAPGGWSIVEVASNGVGALAAFALGQTEALPLSELEDRILGAVPKPPRVTRPNYAAA